MALNKPAPTYGEDYMKRWGLNASLKPAQAAADFYLLMRLELEGKDKGRFIPYRDYLLQQFRAYTDMAVGGEIRHGRTRIGVRSMHNPLGRALLLSTYPANRHQAWMHWYWFRLRWGVAALHWCEAGFWRFTKGGSYGGPKWAKIAHTLRLYEEGGLTKTAFVDTCWGLQHNGGVYLSKTWSVSHVKEVLNANVEDDLLTLQTYASEVVGAMAVSELT